MPYHLATAPLMRPAGVCYSILMHMQPESRVESERIAGLAGATARLHAETFAAPPARTAYAPGRVEILGNHTDYNEGFVLSAAIDAGTCAALSPLEARELRLCSSDGPRTWTVGLSDPFRPEAVDASAYVGGMAHLLLDGRAPGRGACLTVHRDLPLGAGLSSSASLTVATGLLLAELVGLAAEPLDLARLAQRAEHDYAGVRCGLLDPITSLFGREGALVHTDFRSLAVRNVPVPPGVVFLMADTAVKHRLVESAYNERRAACEAAVRALAEFTGRPIAALRDVEPAELEAFGARLDPVVRRRAAHVVGENARVRRGVAALEAGDAAAFGGLMFESHESSRRLFENSCPALDLLVETASRTRGVHGARLSGGGFGGSVVLLVDVPAADSAADALREAFRRQFGTDPATRVVRPSAGARVL